MLTGQGVRFQFLQASIRLTLFGRHQRARDHTEGNLGETRAPKSSANFIVDQRAVANNVNMKLVSLIVTLALFHSVAKADRECIATIKAGSGAVEVKDDNTTTLVKPGERFIAVKPWNPPDDPTQTPDRASDAE